MRHINFEVETIPAMMLVTGAWLFLDDRPNPVMVERVERPTGTTVKVTLGGVSSVTFLNTQMVRVVG